MKEIVAKKKMEEGRYNQTLGIKEIQKLLQKTTRDSKAR
jgi:hypothetical protein